jgi:hypothetical protein
MIVKLPLNIDDEDVFDGMDRIGKPATQPTLMSYFLQRIRLAEISRNLVDRNPIMMAASDCSSYNIVMDIDTELQNLLNDIPPFFSVNKDSVTEPFPEKSVKTPDILTQAYMVHTMIYSQRCKIHLPYLTRGFIEPAYAFSKDICINTARLIIQTEMWLARSDSRLSRFQVARCLMGVFMASVVLLMDMCVNRTPLPQQKGRGELAEAFRILEKARHVSTTASKLLDSLMHILRKHQASPSKLKEQSQAKLGEEADSCSTMMSGQNVCATTISSPYSSSKNLEGDDSNNFGAINEYVNGETSPSSFMNLAQNFEQIAGVDSFDWDSIFTDLDYSFI